MHDTTGQALSNFLINGGEQFELTHYIMHKNYFFYCVTNSLNQNGNRLSFVRTTQCLYHLLSSVLISEEQAYIICVSIRRAFPVLLIVGYWILFNDTHAALYNEESGSSHYAVWSQPCGHASVAVGMPGITWYIWISDDSGILRSLTGNLFAVFNNPMKPFINQLE